MQKIRNEHTGNKTQCKGNLFYSLGNMLIYIDTKENFYFLNFCFKLKKIVKTGC